MHVERMYVKILDKLLFPLASRVAGRRFWRRYHELMKSQWWSQKKIEAEQLRKLKKLVKHSYENVQLYRDLMDKAKVKPSDIKKLTDIEKLPIVTKKDFQLGFPNRCTSTKEGWIVDSTSGSTGKPFQFIRDREFSDWTLASKYRNYTWTGCSVGAKNVSLWGYHPKSMQVTILDSLLRKKFISSFDVDKEFKEYHKYLQRYKPCFIEAYSASLTQFAKLLKSEGLNLHIPSAISSAETLYPDNRKLIEEVLHTKVFDRYGSREGGNIAHECEKHEGLHINAESYIVEVVGKQRGRLIITNLVNFTMPFIRYDTEDYAVMSKKQCKCGRGLPMLKSVEGRVSDYILLPNGAELSFLFFNYFFEQYGAFVREFQVVQEDKTQLLVKIVGTGKFSKEKEKEVLLGLSKQTPRMKITIKRVKKIPLEKSGKRRPVKRVWNQNK